ncbi:MAG TPA: glutathionylspermidine synthase family protein [Rickettsiales bacterium]|nr:glutathionylspermidine synthase family protein [Rickettsiales bacterium]
MKRIAHTSSLQSEEWFRPLGCASLIGRNAWRGDVFYAFMPQEIQRLKDVAAELETLCMQAVEHVIRHRLYDAMLMPSAPSLRQEIERSWERQEPAFCGRLDLAYDGISAPKLLEYNPERPGLLLESALLQRYWLQHEMPHAGQFNEIEARLSQAWRALDTPELVISLLDTPHLHSEEDDIAAFLQRTAGSARINVQIVPRRLIQTDHNRLWSPEGQPIRHLMITHDWYEMLACGLLDCFSPQETRVIEPAWRCLLGNKALLKVLWDLYPDHPNLLHTTLHAEEQRGNYVTKPIIGAMGENITLHHAQEIRTQGRFGAFPNVYQQLASLPFHEAQYAQVGLWVIGGHPAGLIIREDASPIIRYDSVSLPHIVEI